MSSPTWTGVPSDTADLLDLLAETSYPVIPEPERQWMHFVGTLREVARATGLIDQNAVRPLLAGEVTPSRVGAFWRRAALAGLIRADGWNESNHVEQRNAGKPQRLYRWLGTQVLPSAPYPGDDADGT